MVGMLLSQKSPLRVYCLNRRGEDGRVSGMCSATDGMDV